MIDIGIVGYTDNKFVTTNRFTREVNDVPGNNFTVRDHDNLTVNGAHGGGENLHIEHRSGHAAEIDILTCTERTEHYQQDTCGEVRQRALQRQTDG